MQKLNIILKLSIDFLKKYFNDYLKSIARPIVIGIIGVAISLFLTILNPFFAILGLIVAIPSICYAFWKGYLITYALNYQAFYFLKKKNVNFNQCIEDTLKNQNELAKYVTFIALVTIIGYLPTILHFSKNISFQNLIIDPLSITSSLSSSFLVFIISTIILSPFINFSLQAFFFKKDENYFELLINCYKHLDKEGIAIIVLVMGLTTVLNTLFPLIYLILFLPLNLIVYSINLYWYISKANKNG